MAKRRTHLRRRDYAYCGGIKPGTPTTDDPSEVTCKVCLNLLRIYEPERMQALASQQNEA